MFTAALTHQKATRHSKRERNAAAFTQEKADNLAVSLNIDDVFSYPSSPPS